MLAITNLNVQGIGGIENLDLHFRRGLNIICGPNGVGKTTILTCIALSFSNHASGALTRNSRVHDGSWRLDFQHDATSSSQVFTRDTFHPRDQFRGSHPAFIQLAEHLIVFQPHRSFDYISVDALRPDPPRDLNTLSQLALSGTSVGDAKAWFLNRFAWSAHSNVLDHHQLENFELAKRCFGLLDPQVQFSGVIPGTFDIMVSTPGGDIYYEYLSSGFKSCLTILLGLIKEIEYRSPSRHISARDFDGVVLIDELDVHLHPEWQARLADILKTIIPNAQVIATTHSPHVIQSADPSAVIPLAIDSDGKVEVRQIAAGPFGFQGWTVEEILSDVMGLADTRSMTYRRVVSHLEAAIDREDADTAREAFAQLSEMLHPSSVLRKLFALQVGGVGGGAV